MKLHSYSYIPTATSYIYIPIYTILVIRNNEQLADDRFRDIRSSSCGQTHQMLRICGREERGVNGMVAKYEMAFC